MFVCHFNEFCVYLNELLFDSCDKFKFTSFRKIYKACRAPKKKVRNRFIGLENLINAVFVPFISDIYSFKVYQGKSEEIQASTVFDLLIFLHYAREFLRLFIIFIKFLTWNFKIVGSSPNLSNFSKSRQPWPSILRSLTFRHSVINIGHQWYFWCIWFFCWLFPFERWGLCQVPI